MFHSLRRHGLFGINTAFKSGQLALLLRSVENAARMLTTVALSGMGMLMLVSPVAGSSLTRASAIMEAPSELRRMSAIFPNAAKPPETMSRTSPGVLPAVFSPGAWLAASLPVAYQILTLGRWYASVKEAEVNVVSFKFRGKNTQHPLPLAEYHHFSILAGKHVGYYCHDFLNLGVVATLLVKNKCVVAHHPHHRQE